MASVSSKGDKITPFPGLRPYTTGESDYFFGRDAEIKAITDKLLKNRFVAVTGESGTGKSSLINCGIIPFINKKSVKGKSPWKIIDVRPGNDPTGNLPDSLVEDVLNPGRKMVRRHELIKILKEKKEGLSIITGRTAHEIRTKTLLVIDQFEEFFRYTSPEAGMSISDDAEEFINLITDAVTGEDESFHLIIALRTDLISECSRSKVFVQLVNNSNFLVPGMTRENFREVITGPVRKAGAKIDDELVEVLLDDVNEQSDQLPVLQHAMMRTWEEWLKLEEPDRPLRLSDYYSIGTMKDAISRHADDVYGKLDEYSRTICEKLFKIISGRSPDTKDIQYPSDFKTIRAAIGCSIEELKIVADRFRDPLISVITPYSTVPLNDDTIINLSHECLTRLWERLKKWVEEEAESIQMYLHLSEASALYQLGKTGLLKPPDLQLAIKWRDQNKPTLWWAQKYNPAFERAMVYLRTSEKVFHESEEQKARKHRWRLKRIRIISSILGGIAVLTLLSLGAVSLSKVRADSRRKEAEKQKEEMAAKKSWADQYAAIAVRQSIVSDSLASAAMKKEQMEKKMREEAESRLNTVKTEADKAKRIGLAAENTARIAIEQQTETRRERIISLAKSMSLRSLQISGDNGLQALLAYQAYLFNKKYDGNPNDADIYAGLYNLARVNGSPVYRTFSGYNGQIRSLAFAPGKSEFFTSGSDGKILKWNLADKERAFKVIYSDNEIIDVMAVSPGADWLACGGSGSDIKMIPVNGSASPYQLKGHAGKIRSLIFSYDGKSLYSAALDGKVLKWDLTAGTAADLTADGIRITSIDLSSTGKYLAGLSNDGKAVVWNPDQSSNKFQIESAGKAIRSVKFKPDQERIAVGYDDGSIELWDISARRKIAEFRAHNGEVSNIRFNSRHSQMATAGNDGILKLWDTEDFTSLPVSFNDNGGPVIGFEFSPDGEVIVSASVEGKAGIVGRPAYADAFAADGCKYVTRNFTPDEWLSYVGKDIEYEKTCPEADFKIRIREIR